MIGAAIWGRGWSRTRVKLMSDNMAVVQALSSPRAPKDPHMAHLVRCLFFFEAHYSFEHYACHIPGRDNQGADALSRDRRSTFLLLFPQAHPTPEPITRAVLPMLFNPKLNWTSDAWKWLFLDTLARVSPPPLPLHI